MHILILILIEISLIDY